MGRFVSGRGVDASKDCDLPACGREGSMDESYILGACWTNECMIY